MVTDHPKVSVVMAVYNQDGYVGQAVESVLSQTYDNLELIVIDDGSSDHTSAILQEYSLRDPRLVFVSQDNRGLTKSLNTAIGMATGQVIARMDADDVSLERRIEKQVEWIKRGYDVCACRAIAVPTEKVIPSYSWRFHGLAMIYGNPFIHGTLAIKKDLLVGLGGYDERVKYAQDYDLLLRLYGSRARIKYLGEPLYRYRYHSTSISASKRAEQDKFRRFAQKKMLKKICGI